jgi:DNA modification methylase
MTGTRRSTRPDSWYRFDFLTDRVPTSGPSYSAKELDGHLMGPSVPCRSAVTAGKTSRAYNAHSYPTKVPPEAIEPFIDYYSRSGDVVLDPFCGSGMTGLAARRRARHAVLNDLSPLATHLAYNHTARCDPGALRRAWFDLRFSLAKAEARHYSIPCDCGREGRLRYVIWSDVYACPSCAHEVVLWEHGVDRVRGVVSKELACPACRTRWPKSAKSRTGERPVWAAHVCACKSGMQQRALTDSEQESIRRFPAPPAGMFVPRQAVGADREMYQRSALHLRGVQTVADLYTRRNLSALTVLWHAIGEVHDIRVRRALAFAFTNTAWHGTRMRRYNARGGHRPLTGTLYIPQLSSEANVFEVFDNKVAHLARFFGELERDVPLDAPTVHLGSAADLNWVPDASVDYIFTDPPFGANIFYADCNLIAEAWLGCLADTELEAVVNKSRRAAHGGKTLADYGAVIRRAFAEMRRVLKPGRWATIVFQSSDGDVWHTIEAAAAAAGFEIHAAHTLDKVQQSMKGYKGRSGAENVASFDIVLHLRAPVAEPTVITGSATVGVSRTQRELVLASVLEHLAAMPDDATAERTLPYLYSLTVQTLLNAGVSMRGHSMESLRALLAGVTEESDGRWFARTSEVEHRTRHRAPASESTAAVCSSSGALAART